MKRWDYPSYFPNLMLVLFLALFAVLFYQIGSLAAESGKFRHWLAFATLALAVFAYVRVHLSFRDMTKRQVGQIVGMVMGFLLLLSLVTG
jgi:putative effector of murein hydrolase